MKRVFIPIGVALKQARDAYGYPKDYGICACYDVENMGWCKDEVTRWYHFTSVNGNRGEKKIHEPEQGSDALAQRNQ